MARAAAALGAVEVEPEFTLLDWAEGMAARKNKDRCKVFFKATSVSPGKPG
jgi:hypothetical protein